MLYTVQKTTEYVCICIRGGFTIFQACFYSCCSSVPQFLSGTKFNSLSRFSPQHFDSFNILRTGNFNLIDTHLISFALAWNFRIRKFNNKVYRHISIWLRAISNYFAKFWSYIQLFNSSIVLEYIRLNWWKIPSTWRYIFVEVYLSGCSVNLTRPDDWNCWQGDGPGNGATNQSGSSRTSSLLVAWNKSQWIASSRSKRSHVW